MTRAVSTLVVLTLAAALLPAFGTAAQESEPDCPDTTQLDVPGAEFSQATCLEDLTTFSNPRTDDTTFGWGGDGTRESGPIHSEHTDFPEETVPGVQIEGWFEGDSCSHWEIEHNDFIPACGDGHRHNGQFVIRIPNDWDGEHLVVGGTPGIRTQFASDIILSDYALYRGWAYASQDKGNTGLNFFRAGDDETGGSHTTWEPPVAIAQWADRMGKAAVAAEGALEQLHGQRPSLTYAAGISNGGYQTRLALERHPELFDAGVDWEGTIFTPEGPHIYTYIPPLLQAYPEYSTSGDEDAYRKLVHEGRVPPHSEPVWEHHYNIYWGTVASAYRPVVDPEYTDDVAAPRTFVAPQDPDAQYDYPQRLEETDFLRGRMEQISVTGDINGKPLITLHGTLDALLPISTHGDVYARMVREQGHGDDFRYYVVEGGEHVDPSADENPDVMRPILPCFWGALDALEAWVTSGTEPPPSGFVPFPADRTEEERANTCQLPPEVDRVAGADREATALRASRQGFGITPTVIIATAGAFPDALAAAPLAHAVEAPVLLVGDGVSEELEAELHRLGATNAIVVGGDLAVSDDVVGQLEELGLEVRRIAGADRFATAAAIADEVGSDGEAFVVNGTAFPDAVSVAPVAASDGIPILLVGRDHIPSVTADALGDLSIDRTFVAGGQHVVSDVVHDALPAPGRIAGADRYATSVAVGEFGLQRGHSLETLYVATGRNWPDALTAGPVASLGGQGTVPHGLVLLVDGRDPFGGAASHDFVRRHGDAISQVLLFGGPNAISADVSQRLQGIVTG